LPGGFQGRNSIREAFAKQKVTGVDFDSKLMPGENPNRQVLDNYLLVNNGNSGGPLLDSDDQVVGIVGLSDIENSAIATPVEDLRNLLGFVRRQEVSSQPQIYMDISENDSMSESRRRAESRGNALMSDSSFRSVIGRSTLNPLRRAPNYFDRDSSLPGINPLFKAGRPRLSLEAGG